MIKLLILFLFLLSSQSFAGSKFTTAKGYGSTQEEALADAKKNAIEMVVGTWLDSKTDSVNGSFRNKTTAFTTGTVNSFKVIESGEGYVIIDAEVLDRKTAQVLESKAAQLNSYEKDQMMQVLENDKNMSEAVASIDDITQAVICEVKSFRVKPMDLSELEKESEERRIMFTEKYKNSVILEIRTQYKINPSWVAKYKELKKKTDKRLNLENIKDINSVAILKDKDGKIIFQTAPSKNDDPYYLLTIGFHKRDFKGQMVVNTKFDAALINNLIIDKDLIAQLDSVSKIIVKKPQKRVSGYYSSF